MKGEDFKDKSTTDEIRARFDADVERFANLQTGQTSTLDAPLAMELITQAAFATAPRMRKILDIGCGAGNNTLKILEMAKDPDCDLLDLSPNMLERAKARVCLQTKGEVRTICEDLRTAPLAENTYDVVIAAAVLHHLRDDADWLAAFKKIHSVLKTGGGFWISDLVSHEPSALHSLMWDRYGKYLCGVGGAEYRDKVFKYIAHEDSPRPLAYQLELLKKVGFRYVEVLHKNSCFAAFGAVK